MNLRKFTQLSKATAVHGFYALHLARRAIRYRNAWQRTAELMSLIGTVRNLRPRVILEIGSYRGGTLYCWSRVAPMNSLLISVDLPGLGHLQHDENRAAERKGFEAFLKPGQSLHCLQSDSQSRETMRQVADLLDGRSIDFLFIDGDHRYQGVKTDFELYSPLVRSSGLIALHDIRENPQMPHSKVYRFWRELQQSGDFSTREFVDASDPQSTGMGIGVLIKP